MPSDGSRVSISRSLPVSTSPRHSRPRSSTIVSCSPSSYAKKGFFENFFDEGDVQVLHEQLSVTLECARDLCKHGFFSVKHLLVEDDLLLEEVIAAHCDAMFIRQECARILSVAKKIDKQLQCDQQLSSQELSSKGSGLCSEDSNQTTHEAHSFPSSASQQRTKGRNYLAQEGVDQRLLTSALSKQSRKDEEDAGSTVSDVTVDSRRWDDGVDLRVEEDTLGVDSDDEMLFAFDSCLEGEGLLQDSSSQSSTPNIATSSDDLCDQFHPFNI